MMRKYCYRLALIMWLVGLVACTSGTAPASNPEPSSPMIDPIGPPSSAVEGVSDDEIVIGVSAAFSGPSQGLGVELYRGAMAYLEEVNANGASTAVAFPCASMMMATTPTRPSTTPFLW